MSARQMKGKDTALAHLAVRIHLPTVRIYNPPGDRKTKAYASMAPGVSCLVEFLKDTGKVLFGDPLAVVFDLSDDIPVGIPDPDLHHGPFG